MCELIDLHQAHKTFDIFCAENKNNYYNMN